MLLSPDKSLAFTHRVNTNGTFDSFCSQCFASVAHRASLMQLELKEQKHVCIPWVAEQYQQ